LTGGGRKNPVPAREGLTTYQRQQLQRLRRENWVLREEKANHEVSRMCGVLDVSIQPMTGEGWHEANGKRPGACPKSAPATTGPLSRPTYSPPRLPNATSRNRMSAMACERTAPHSDPVLRTMKAYA